ncbi:MAG TPA: GNAT family N-acetyltransferase [Ktedonobacterales bacterium]|jgi:GNAT superfamily N-acetyltransferase|nr:GNAT family N-acetyltransferase [Ktedonobacterales bacterium]
MTAELVIAPLDPSHAEGLLDALDTLLRDAVASGASVGFLPPLKPEESRAFWQETLDEVATGTRLALGAWLDEQLVGTVHLALATKPNGRHRGEVQKLLVHTSARRQGIAQKLLEAIERVALDSGRTLLVLDTEQGSDAERLYRRVGYTEAGVIPRFAATTAGPLTATVIFYKELDRSDV